MQIHTQHQHEHRVDMGSRRRMFSAECESITAVFFIIIIMALVHGGAKGVTVRLYSCFG